jgi:hypothetical protein
MPEVQVETMPEAQVETMPEEYKNEKYHNKDIDIVKDSKHKLEMKIFIPIDNMNSLSSDDNSSVENMFNSDSDETYTHDTNEERYWNYIEPDDSDIKSVEV